MSVLLLSMLYIAITWAICPRSLSFSFLRDCDSFQRVTVCSRSLTKQGSGLGWFCSRCRCSCVATCVFVSLAAFEPIVPSESGILWPGSYLGPSSFPTPSSLCNNWNMPRVEDSGIHIWPLNDVAFCGVLPYHGYLITAAEASANEMAGAYCAFS